MTIDDPKNAGSLLAIRCYKISRTIHWISVALVMTLLLTALFSGIDPHGSGNGAFLWHSSLGITLYLMTISRAFLWLIYRTEIESIEKSVGLTAIPPGLRIAFYVLLIALPISGWILASEEGLHSSLLGIPALPQWYHGAGIHPDGADTPSTVLANRIHGGLAVALFLVVAGHLMLAFRNRRAH